MQNWMIRWKDHCPRIDMEDQAASARLISLVTLSMLETCLPPCMHTVRDCSCLASWNQGQATQDAGDWHYPDIVAHCGWASADKASWILSELYFIIYAHICAYMHIFVHIFMYMYISMYLSVPIYVPVRAQIRPETRTLIHTTTYPKLRTKIHTTMA